MSFIAVLAFAAAIRFLPPDGAIPVGGPDAFYQIRRAELVQSGKLEHVDRWSNYPMGTEVHWPTLYPKMLAWLMPSGYPDLYLILPIVAAILTLLVIKKWADDFQFGLGLTALLSAVPAFLYPTLFGAIDHHCVELLFFAAALSAGSLRTAFAIPLIVCATALSFMTTTTWPLVVIAGSTVLLLHRLKGEFAGWILAGAAVAIPIAGWDYISNPWLADIPEAQPLIASGRDLFKAIVALSPGFLFIPFAAWRWWADRSSGRQAAMLAATAISLPLALLQSRFVLYLAIPSVFALGEILAFAATRYKRALVVLFAVISIFPVARGVMEIRTWPPDPTPALRKALLYLSGTGSAATAPAAQPRWCVVAPWDLGNHILLLGRAPIMANAFHTSPEGRTTAHEILFSDTVHANALAHANHAKFLLLTDLVTGGYAAKYKRSSTPLIETLYGRLYLLRGGESEWELVHASEESVEIAGITTPSVQIWRRIAHDY